MILEKGDLNIQKVSDSKFTNVLNETRAFSASTQASSKATIFLSHKHDELDDLKGAIGLFQSLGAKVYIDSMDKSMPNTTSKLTATRIKDIIRRCDKFVFLATELAIASKWCNWEVGYGDAYKYNAKIVILPMKNKGEIYKGNEYLQIYSTIQRRLKLNQTTNTHSWYYYIADVRGTEICSLYQWINS